MLDRRHEPMSSNAFFAWQEAQAERYELVGGVPVRMMAGRATCATTSSELLARSRTALRGSGCRPVHGDGSVETLPGQIRRPDIGVDCGTARSECSEGGGATAGRQGAVAEHARLRCVPRSSASTARSPTWSISCWWNPMRRNSASDARSDRLWARPVCSGSTQRSGCRRSGSPRQGRGLRRRHVSGNRPRLVADQPDGSDG